jgi:membrane protein CcdC involved in cytochrome C biogenesis
MNQGTHRMVRLAGILEATAVFLFLYQALRVLFSVLFGVVYDAIYAGRVPMSTAGLLFGAVVLALLAPTIAPRQPSARRIGRFAAALLVFLARIPMTANDPQQRLAAAVFIIAGAGVYLATRLRSTSWDVIRALVLALVFDQILRAFGQTFDVTLRTSWWYVQATLSLALCLLAGWLWRKQPPAETDQVVRPGVLGGLAWGGWLFLEMSLLAFPNAVARWSGVSLEPVARPVRGFDSAASLLPSAPGERASTGDLPCPGWDAFPAPEPGLCPHLRLCVHPGHPQRYGAGRRSHRWAVCLATVSPPVSAAGSATAAHG